MIRGRLIISPLKASVWKGRRVFASVAWAIALALPMGRAVAGPQSAHEAYEQVSTLRDRHADVIWGGASATPEDLHSILDDLDRGLRTLDEPIYRDLGNGDFYLKMRAYNFLVDKVIVQARLGETADAIQSFDEMTRVAWLPAPSRPEFDALLNDPRAAAIKARIEVGSRWRSASLASPYRAQLPVEERIAGLAAIWSLAREHFVWFDHVPGLDWDRAYQEAVPKVIQAHSTAEYYRELMRFTALLKDGHSNAYPPDALSEDFYGRPGLSTSLLDGSVIVTEISDATLAERGIRVGDQVLEVDGVDVHRYAIHRVAPFQSSSTPQDLAARTYGYALLSGSARQSVKLAVQHPDGSRVTILARRSGYPPQPGGASESFEMRADGVAVLKARQFEDGAADQLMAMHAGDVRRADALVIDIRGNGGGSSKYGLDVLTWLTNGALPVSRQAVRADPDLIQGNGRMMAWRLLPTTTYQRTRDQVFTGPVALLIDERTFSAAEDMAVSFRALHRGMIVGSPSGGSTGEPFMIDLPGGGHARICVKRDSYPDGAEFVGAGVQPDVWVSVTKDSIRSGSDPVLERAVAELTRQVQEGH